LKNKKWVLTLKVGKVDRFQTCAESHFFKEKSSQVTQKSSHDFDFFEKNKKVKVMTLTFLKKQEKVKVMTLTFLKKTKKVKVMTLTFFKKPKKVKVMTLTFFKKPKKVKVMTLTFFKGPLENTFRRFL
jgi:hypothetical protein